jgi:hypothetical protein
MTSALQLWKLLSKLIFNCSAMLPTRPIGCGGDAKQNCGSDKGMTLHIGSESIISGESGDALAAQDRVPHI